MQVLSEILSRPQYCNNQKFLELEHDLQREYKLIINLDFEINTRNKTNLQHHIEHRSLKETSFDFSAIQIRTGSYFDQKTKNDAMFFHPDMESILPRILIVVFYSSGYIFTQFNCQNTPSSRQLEARGHNLVIYLEILNIINAVSPSKQ